MLLGGILALTAAVFLIAMAVFDNNEPDPAPQESSEPSHEPFEAEALEAAEIMTTWTPAEDFNRTESELRAAHLMSEELAASIESPERAASGAEWRSAAEQNATSQPSVQLNEQTDAQNGMVSVFASWQWVTEEGDVLGTDPDERIYYFTFNDRGEIHDYTYETVRNRSAENST